MPKARNLPTRLAHHPTVATEEEVSQLRSEVAAQRKTIEELKGMVQQLAEANCNPPRRFRPTLKGKPEMEPPDERGFGVRTPTTRDCASG